MEVGSGLPIGRAVPYVTLPLVHVVNKGVGVAVQYVQRQVDYRVATRVMEGVGVIAAFGQRAVAESVTAALADGFLNVGVRDISDGQIQNVLYAVYAVRIRNRLHVST